MKKSCPETLRNEEIRRRCEVAGIAEKVTKSRTFLYKFIKSYLKYINEQTLYIPS